MQAFFVASIFSISSRSCQCVSPREGQMYFSQTQKTIDTISCSDGLFFRDIVTWTRQQAPLLSIHKDIYSHTTVQTCWTGNKSDRSACGVMFNNKKYYLPWSMCVAVTIKYNKWKVLEDCSKFWCVAILSTLWQRATRQGSKTSSNRLLNIRPQHSCTPWLLYIKLQAVRRRNSARGITWHKIGQWCIFISGEWAWVEVGLKLNGCVAYTSVSVWQQEGINQSI